MKSALNVFVGRFNQLKILNVRIVLLLRRGWSFLSGDGKWNVID
jgi:hypothetical protein